MSNQSVGLAPRALAMAIDGVLMVAASTLLMWAVYGDPVAKWNDLRPATIAIHWLLPLIVCVVFWSWQGATPGKLVAGLKVVDARSGKRPSPPQAALRWLGYLVSTIPLFAGFLWARVDAEGRTWHDRLSRTAVLRSREAPANGEGLLIGYIASHWRGEQGLAQSFWINHVLLTWPVAAGVQGLVAWLSTKSDGLQGVAIALLIVWPLLIVIEVWSAVGAWRAIRPYVDDGGSYLMAGLARLALGLSLLQIAFSLAIGVFAEFPDLWKLARGIDPIGNVRLSVSADGRTMQLSGPIGAGDASRLGALLATAPAVKLLEVASPGGRLTEAERMVALIRQRTLGTRAVGNCESACTLVFLAGNRRQMMPGAQLGFHRASSGSFNPAFDEIANQELARTYRRMELPEDFIRKTLDTPSRRMWYPAADDLVRHSLILPPPKTLDVALPEGDKPGHHAPLTDYVNALRASDAWFKLEQRFPGLIDEAASRMRTAHVALAESEHAVDGAQIAAQDVLAPRVRELLLTGSPSLRRSYLQVLRVQLAAAQGLGRETCQSWLSGSPVPRRLLSEDAMAWEARWLIEAADDPPPLRNRATTPTALELEVLSRSVGSTAAGAFSKLWTGGTAGAAPITCERAGQVLDQIQRTPVAPRELAERIVFQNPR
ncbi:RDD family protein [Mitsuaria sp. GD03876]|uniref:RDD family protein n=1 Tax=Mitsuaria sp. GD03876 TaxID=2975399 RepID=UPI00244B8147|nr:RDD family protein [Mitsuaria sp. GD03876]MDH0863758.1 RDD family protein [Mitsuaria sp. GD03876]